jgi:TRAP transporter TAXI family solute receptor
MSRRARVDGVQIVGVHMPKHRLAQIALIAFAGTSPHLAFAQTDTFPLQRTDERIVVAQSTPPAKRAPRAPTAAAVGEAEMINKANTWTVGLAAGLPEGTFLAVGAEIARNLNDGDDMRVLPMVTQGATDNIRDLLYLKGVDIAITHTDVFEHFRTVEKIENIEKRVNYITGLYVSEIHLVVRSDINSINDLAGKKVSFHIAGAGSTVTGPIVFQRLGIKVEPVFVSNQIALEKMKTGEIAGFVHNGGKPNNLIARFKNDPGFKILEIPFDKFDEYYVPAVFGPEDYPNFIKPGQKVETIAVPAVLAVYNWPKSSDRFRRVNRFIDQFFDKFERFKGPGYQPQWKDINLAAQVPGWSRYWVAEDKLKQLSGNQQAAGNGAGRVDVQLARQQAARAAPGDSAEQERIFQRFLDWSRQQNKR